MRDGYDRNPPLAVLAYPFLSFIAPAGRGNPTFLKARIRRYDGWAALPPPIVIPAQAGINSPQGGEYCGAKPRYRRGFYIPVILAPEGRGNPSAIMRKHYRQPFG